MIDPEAASDIMRAVIAGALVIMAGAGYALLFAFGRLRSSRGLIAGALGFYALLAAAVFVLADALNLNGYWQILVAVMLGGYFMAPRWIWGLCEGTHAYQSEAVAAGGSTETTERTR